MKPGSCLMRFGATNPSQHVEINIQVNLAVPGQGHVGKNRNVGDRRTLKLQPGAIAQVLIELDNETGVVALSLSRISWQKT